MLCNYKVILLNLACIAQLNSMDTQLIHISPARTVAQSLPHSPTTKSPKLEKKSPSLRNIPDEMEYIKSVSKFSLSAQFAIKSNGLTSLERATLSYSEQLLRAARRNN